MTPRSLEDVAIQSAIPHPRRRHEDSFQLHAQGKPPVYTIVEIDVSNNEAYMKEYAPKAIALVKEKGGKVIAPSNGVGLEGAPPFSSGKA